MSWSYPSNVWNPETQSYENDGMVWFGTEAATDEDYAALAADGAKKGLPDVAVDERSVVGRHHRDWSTHFDEMTGKPPESKQGGLGSPVYERQHLHSGVEMRKDKVWHYDVDGNYVCEVPQSPHGLGACHKAGEMDDTHAGAKPGSEAQVHLDENDLEINWDVTDEWWVYVTRGTAIRPETSPAPEAEED